MKIILKIATGIFLGLILVGGLWLVARVPQGESVTLNSPPTAEFIQVNVVGAVKYPGVYELEANSRVADAVEAAGGFMAEADKSNLNLAALVVNAQRLDIPYKSGFTLDEVQDTAVGTGETPSPLGASSNLDIGTATSIDTNVDTTTVAISTVIDSCSDGATGSPPTDGSERCDDRPSRVLQRPFRRSLDQR